MSLPQAHPDVPAAIAAAQRWATSPQQAVLGAGRGGMGKAGVHVCLILSTPQLPRWQDSAQLPDL